MEWHEIVTFVLVCFAIIGNLFWGSKALAYQRLMSAPNLYGSLKAMKKEAKLADKTAKQAIRERDKERKLVKKLQGAIDVLENKVSIATGQAVETSPWYMDFNNLRTVSDELVDFMKSESLKEAIELYRLTGENLSEEYSKSQIINGIIQSEQENSK